MSITILGAGLQGCCIALELSRRGIKVILVDQDEIPMNRASLRNEGKIHLGLIYANDPTLATAKLQLQGALHFHCLLQRWLGTKINQIRYCQPFIYLVAQDSILNAQQLSEHYEQLNAIYLQEIKNNPQLNYLGNQPERLYNPLSLGNIHPYAANGITSAFSSAERAIATHDLAIVIRQAIAEQENISFLNSRKVTGVTRSNYGFVVEGIGWQIEAEQVINATWESRLAIDSTMGIQHPPGWLHRLKYRVIVTTPEHLRNAPCATMVIGRYGDVVFLPDNTTYLSWYPIALRGWSNELSPPDAWQEACKGEVATTEAHQLAAEVCKAINPWLPGIADAQPLMVDAGAIFAYGRTDVDDPKSQLHDRTGIGVTSFDGYHSVSTGKLTTAPLFALSTVEKVLG